ncbi:MAG: hypothetical protein J7M34_04555 [Anaerolineae bacterium]|nr:hypothetical protein [Anaerolineae bacterium]
MPRVRCPQSRCIFWEDGYCTAEEIELDPEQLSCLTMEELEDEVIDDDDVWGDDGELLDDEDGWIEDEDDESDDGWLVEDDLNGFVLTDEDDW